MSQPTITIGIPTWNRCAYLQKNLTALIRQIHQYQLNENVEILISDNASTDETANICHELAAQHSFMTYHCHPQNRGANANFQYVIEAAQGEYVWLLGDDDLIAEDVIANVIRDIKQNSPAAAVGPAIYDHTQEKATHQSYHQLVVTNRDVLTQEDVIGLAGKISGLIFHKSSVMPVIALTEPVVISTRTPWPHLAWLIVLLNNSQNKLLILPYGINQLVAANWHNLLFNGKTLLKILVLEYQSLILALKPLLEPLFFQSLLNHSIATRAPTLLKCVLYATYLDDYWEMLSLATRAWPTIDGTKNKLNYLLFLLCPLSIPPIARKSAYKLASYRWQKLRVTLERIERAKMMMRSQAAVACREYDEQQL